MNGFHDVSPFFRFCDYQETPGREFFGWQYLGGEIIFYM